MSKDRELKTWVSEGQYRLIQHHCQTRGATVASFLREAALNFLIDDDERLSRLNDMIVRTTSEPKTAQIGKDLDL